MSKVVKDIDKAYARCKACNTSFYPRWREEVKEFEDLCWKCLGSARYTARVDPVLYGSGKEGTCVHPDKWEQTDLEKDTEWLESWVKENPIGAHGDLWKEDEYLQYGEGSMGDLGLLDNLKEGGW